MVAFPSSGESQGRIKNNHVLVVQNKGFQDRASLCIPSWPNLYTSISAFVKTFSRCIHELSSYSTTIIHLLLAPFLVRNSPLLHSHHRTRFCKWLRTFTIGPSLTIVLHTVVFSCLHFPAKDVCCSLWPHQSYCGYRPHWLSKDT